MLNSCVSLADIINIPKTKTERKNKGNTKKKSNEKNSDFEFY
jgi:hypothetical protein